MPFRIVEQDIKIRQSNAWTHCWTPWGTPLSTYEGQPEHSRVPETLPAGTVWFEAGSTSANGRQLNLFILAILLPGERRWRGIAVRSKQMDKLRSETAKTDDYSLKTGKLYSQTKVCVCS